MFKIISIGRKRPFFMEYCKIDKKVQFRYNKRKKKEMRTMSSNKSVVPSAREALNKFKMEAANDLALAAPS